MAKEKSKPLPYIDEQFNKLFWDKVNIPENKDECWIWQASFTRKKIGYGRFHINRRSYTAHRVSYLINFGVDPKEMCVCHNCDNPKCVNPKHLFLGTIADNNSDKAKKGRYVSPKYWQGKSNPCRQGVNSNFATLNEAQVISIRNEYKPHIVTMKMLGDKYNVGVTTVYDIVKNKTWLHLLK